MKRAKIFALVLCWLILSAFSGVRPSYHQNFARGPSDSAYPQFWEGAIGMWATELGPTGNMLFDWSGFKNHGTLTSMNPADDWEIAGVTRISGMGYTLLFDGTLDHVLVPDSPSLTVSSITVLAWVKGDAQDRGRVVAQYDIGTTQRSWILGSGDSGGGDDGKIEVALSNDGTFDAGQRKRYTSSLTAFDGTWHRVGFTYDGTTLTLFVDGTPDTSPEKEFDDAVSLHDSTVNLSIGSELSSGSPSGEFTGNISDIRVYNRVLPNSEILLDYQLFLAPFILRSRMLVRAPAAAATFWGTPTWGTPTHGTPTWGNPTW